MLGEERLGAVFISALNSTQKLALLLSDHHEKRRVVLRQVGGRLLKVRNERSGENLKHTVAAGFKQDQMEFTVPAVGFLRIDGKHLKERGGEHRLRGTSARPDEVREDHREAGREAEGSVRRQLDNPSYAAPVDRLDRRLGHGGEL